MKHCPSTAELQDFLHGTLNAGASSRLNEHLDACEACAAELDRIDQVALQVGLPALKESGLSDKEIIQLTITNPAKAFAIQVRAA